MKLYQSCGYPKKRNKKERVANEPAKQNLKFKGANPLSALARLMSVKIRKRVVISSESESSPSRGPRSSESSEQECELPSLLERLHRRQSSTSVASKKLSPFKSKASNFDEKENIPSCSICFTSPAESPSYPDCCNHTFCQDCLVKWSDMLNICPLCKRKFLFICDLLQAGKKIKVIDKKQPKYLEDDTYFNQTEEAIYCALCGTDTNEQVLLLCDGCNVGMHTYCLTPPLREVPPGEWFCPECQESRQAQENSNTSRGHVAARNRRTRRRTTRTSGSTRSQRQRSRRRLRGRQQGHDSMSASRRARNSESPLCQVAAINNLNIVCPQIISDESDESSSGYASDDSFLQELWVQPEENCEHSSFSSECSEIQIDCSFGSNRPNANFLPRDIMYRYGIGGARATGCSRQVLGGINPNFVPKTPENKT
ncbi:hypothetical protein GpartN1_g2021.t1 [Galdieria partita]|uniref:PHD and RING finger domain-containing protein 1 n=1 Tax=Galdieria partita TaxID=83374 RepID=A0A9C7PTQ5_9RHOD|nr:hypothetical protein GpartN1_g2021.t1 [Galdieria partita]